MQRVRKKSTSSGSCKSTVYLRMIWLLADQGLVQFTTRDTLFIVIATRRPSMPCRGCHEDGALDSERDALAPSRKETLVLRERLRLPTRIEPVSPKFTHRMRTLPVISPDVRQSGSADVSPGAPLVFCPNHPGRAW